MRQKFREVKGILDYFGEIQEQVIGKARMACFNSGQRIEDHFVEVDEMIELEKGRDGYELFQ